MKTARIFSFISTQASLLLLIASPVLAQKKGSTINVTRPPTVTFENIGSLIGGAVGVIIILALILTFFYLIIGGISWITSGGDKGQVEAARNRITNALIGLAIVAGAWALMKLVGFFFGIDPFSLDIPTVKE